MRIRTGLFAVFFHFFLPVWPAGHSVIRHTALVGQIHFRTRRSLPAESTAGRRFGRGTEIRVVEEIKEIADSFGEMN
jgi:hypothetical protein